MPTNWSPALKETLQLVAHTIRQLSMEAVQKANSGHPGLPLGCAEIGAYLYGHQLRHNPENPDLPTRDRLILSAGHGSAWLYSCLHLAGFALTLDDVKAFRQMHSKTPGHPEYRHTPGVETTTGPLGQGFGHAVGQALGLKMQGILEPRVYTLVGDGCMMEGVAFEAASLAGHLGLNNLVCIYDSNKICLDGPVDECFSDNTRQRFEALGWDVIEVDGNDLDSIHQGFSSLTQPARPTLVIAHTVIGKGSVNKSGTSKVHGSPLGPEEVALTKKALGLPEEAFYVAPSVRDFFAKRLTKQRLLGNAKAASFVIPADLEEKMLALAMPASIATRSSSHKALQTLAELVPAIVGGSADLSCSDMTMLEGKGLVKAGHYTARNIKYGVREFAMASVAIGLTQSGPLRPYVGTFLTFSDYMRNSIRLASMMQVPVIYQFTHDSVFLGEDGPTHQPVEHVASLRLIPHLRVVRCADANEVKLAWVQALKATGPTALILSRQNLPTYEATNRPLKDGLDRGGYVLLQEKLPCKFTLLASGSEVSLAVDTAKLLEEKGHGTRVVSVPCLELFMKQDAVYRKEVLSTGRVVSIEAGVAASWKGISDLQISVEDFGYSAPAGVIASHLGFTKEAIAERLLRI